MISLERSINLLFSLQILIRNLEERDYIASRPRWVDSIIKCLNLGFSSLLHIPNDHATHQSLAQITVAFTSGFLEENSMLISIQKPGGERLYRILASLGRFDH